MTSLDRHADAPDSGSPGILALAGLRGAAAWERWHRAGRTTTTARLETDRAALAAARAERAAALMQPRKASMTRGPLGLPRNQRSRESGVRVRAQPAEGTAGFSPPEEPTRRGAPLVEPGHAAVPSHLIQHRPCLHVVLVAVAEATA